MIGVAWAAVTILAIVGAATITAITWAVVETVRIELQKGDPR